MSAAIEIVGGDALTELAELEALAEAIFGRGDRRPGWFRRKLRREGVVAELSSLALAPADDAPAARVQGYALLGRAPSLGGIARGAGVGVIATARRRGLGRALLERSRRAAAAAGCEAIEFLAEPERLPWYEALGFAAIAEQRTLLAHGLGEREATIPEEQPPTELGEPLWSWIPEIWTRTPAPERALVELDGARFWLTREGRAWLVHRCELDDPAILERRLVALRRRFARTTPVLLYPCPANAPWLAKLAAIGFATAQRSFLVRQTTDGSG